MDTSTRDRWRCIECGALKPEGRDAEWKAGAGGWLHRCPWVRSDVPWSKARVLLGAELKDSGRGRAAWELDDFDDDPS